MIANYYVYTRDIFYEEMSSKDFILTTNVAKTKQFYTKQFFMIHADLGINVLSSKDYERKSHRNEKYLELFLKQQNF